MNGKGTSVLRVFFWGEGTTAFGQTSSIRVSSLLMCLTLSRDESSSAFVSVGVGFCWDLVVQRKLLQLRIKRLVEACEWTLSFIGSRLSPHVLLFYICKY